MNVLAGELHEQHVVVGGGACLWLWLRGRGSSCGRNGFFVEVKIAKAYNQANDIFIASVVFRREMLPSDCRMSATGAACDPEFNRLSSVVANTITRHGFATFGPPTIPALNTTFGATTLQVDLRISLLHSAPYEYGRSISLGVE